LLFSTTLLIKEFRTVERWQAKGLKIYYQKLEDFNNWKTCIKPDKPAQWLTANPIFIALKAWVELLSNLISLFIAIISSTGFYFKMRKQKLEGT
jgi:hypothetical protein